MSDLDIDNEKLDNQQQPEYFISSDCDVRGIERMRIGKGVVVQQGCWLNIAYYNPHGDYIIEIGEGTNIGRRCTISAANKVKLGNHVLLGPNVFIADTSHEYKNIEVPIMYQGITTINDRVLIGDNTWIGTNAVIVGNVQIGKGCVIGANSIVNRDIPDYCVAVGSPAKVVKAYDVEKREWISVKSNKELENVLFKRNKVYPILSIAIPTYNREKDISICLESIFSQIGDDLRFEVVVSNNNSTDSTEQIILSYCSKYRNLKYFKNQENIGGDENILKVLGLASGEFILLHGDDDYFRPDILYRLLDIIQNNRDCGIVFINVLNDDKEVRRMTGMNSFLSETSINSSFISSIILRKSEFDKLETPDKFMASKFNQAYIQYSILENNPNFCVVNDAAFFYACNPPSGYNFGEVFMKNYLSILEYFEDKGLSKDFISKDKLKILGTTVFPWYQRILKQKLPLDVSNFEEIFIENYKDEPYFNEMFNVIKYIQQNA